MSDIQKAIEHLDDILSNDKKWEECEECKQEHIQLREWLKELQQYWKIGTLEECREAREKKRWIPCSERLPNEEEMRNVYCSGRCGSEFIVMIDGAKRPTVLCRTLDGLWKDDSENAYKVIAWRPLPEPYKTEKER